MIVYVVFDPLFEIVIGVYKSLVKAEQKCAKLNQTREVYFCEIHDFNLED